LLRGWCGYFNLGPVAKTHHLIRRYTEWRIRRWLTRRTGQRGTGYTEIPDKYLYETLGLYAIPIRRADLSRAKV
jgi:RNA-directed DNA polymerase